MKRLMILLLAAAFLPLGAQNRTQHGTLTSQKKYPLLNYFELPQPSKPDPAQWAKVKGVQVSWGSADAAYAKTEVPAVKALRSIRLEAWKGETVMAQALVWSAGPVPDLTFTLSDLRGPAVIPASAAETGFVRFNPGPDVIDTFPQSLDLQPMNSQPYWVSLAVPRGIPAGLYEGSLTVRSGALTIAKLRLSLKVDPRALPEPSEWTGVPFIVPNPWAVARYYHLEEWKTEYTEPWSEKHFGYMKPLMERLASIGVRDIPVFDSDGDASLTDAVRSMTSVLRRSDGVERRFTDVRDAWIAFLRSCGFDGEVVHLSGQLPDGARWYNAWPAEVLLDGRASPEHPGDSYLVYPGNRPSVRWMLLLRDLQQKQK